MHKSICLTNDGGDRAGAKAGSALDGSGDYSWLGFCTSGDFNLNRKEALHLTLALEAEWDHLPVSFSIGFAVDMRRLGLLPCVHFSSLLAMMLSIPGSSSPPGVSRCETPSLLPTLLEALGLFPPSWDQPGSHSHCRLRIHGNQRELLLHTQRLACLGGHQRGLPPPSRRQAQEAVGMVTQAPLSLSDLQK